MHNNYFGQNIILPKDYRSLLNFKKNVRFFVPKVCFTCLNY